ncbi:hemogen isoform X2 [Tiliqua scincoides]|uniref:hemogen isoform X2 n=1 Tax=Tiliqua scincoides TaxID=71010 RepID=UPI003463645C
MESLEKEHSYSENPQQPSATTEEYAVPEVVITRRLRDRELLRKRKAEAEEKETHQDQKKSKPARKGKGTGRGRGRRQAPEPETQAETHEPPVITLEETAETTLDPQVETSLPPEAEELYTPKEVAEATPAGGATSVVELEETPRSEEPEILESLENDHLEQEFHGSF